MNQTYLLSRRLPHGKERVGLRRPEEEDIDLYLDSRNDPRLYPFLSITFPVSRGEQEEWLKQRMALLGPSPKEVVLSIDLDDELAGCVDLHNIDWVNRHAGIGIAIFDAEHRRKGVGTAVYTLMAEFAFNTLGLHALRAGVFGGNPASDRFHRKCGFRLAGTFHIGAFKNGRWESAPSLRTHESGPAQTPKGLIPSLLKSTARRRHTRRLFLIRDEVDRRFTCTQ